MLQVLADLIPAVSVLSVIRLHLDCAAVFENPEMVGSFLVREAHGVIAAVVHCAVAIAGRFILAVKDCRREKRGESELYINKLRDLIDQMRKLFL